jgi:dTDP-4-amino-4,6-dideoxygalactose transaminase
MQLIFKGGFMAVPQFDLTRQYKKIEREVEAKVHETLASGAYILGPALVNFEKSFAEYNEVKYAFGVASGTDALLLALRAADIKPGDEVITTAFTFFATAEVIAILGAKPVFADIKLDNYNIDPEDIARKITPRTKAIMPVHLFGLPCNMDPILKLAKEHNLVVIEDCAQAVGAQYKGKKAGSFGDFGCFSFFPTKNLGCCGDGGAIITNREEMAEKIRMLRVHGSKKKYYHEFLGYNSRLDTIQAAILEVKLKHLDEWIESRRSIANFYNSSLRDIVIQVPEEQIDTFHVYHQYTLRVENRDKLVEHLKMKGIGTAIYYPLPLHLQPALKHLGYKPQTLPNTERACEEVISLPIFPELERREMEEVVNAIREFYAK